MMKIRIFFIFLFIFTKATYSQEPCVSLYRSGEKTQEITQNKKVIEVRNVEDFLRWISSPSFNWQLLKEPDIEKAFILALKYSVDFSDKGFWGVYGIRQYNLVQLQESFGWLKEYLTKKFHSKKKFFPDISVQIRDVRENSFLIGKLKELKDLSQRQVKAGHELMKILFNIRESLHYWKEKIFQEIQGEKSLLKEGEFEKFINQLDSLEKKERLKEIFYFLNDKREILVHQGRHEDRISKVIVDLIHYAPAFYHLDIFEYLKSNGLLEKVQAMHHMIHEREKFITELGLELSLEEGLFHQVLKKYNRSMPSGYSKKNEMENLYEEIKRIDFQSISALSEASDSFHMWYLPHLIAPFRGYLGFTCASCFKHRFIRALSSYSHYFAVNQKGGLKGYIEVVLNEVVLKLNQEKKKVAIIRRLQNIQRHLLPVVIEALRQSLLTKGYVLVKPRFMSGSHLSKFSHNIGLIEEFSYDRELIEEFSNIGVDKDVPLHLLNGTYFLQIQDLAIDIGNGFLKKSGLIPRIHGENNLSLTDIKLVETDFSYESFEVQLNLDHLVSQMLFDLLNQAKDGSFSDKLKYVSLKHAVQWLNGVGRMSFEEVLAGGLEFRLALFLVWVLEGKSVLEMDSTQIFSKEEITRFLVDRLFFLDRMEGMGDRFEVVFLFSIWYAGFIKFWDLVILLESRGLLHLSRGVALKSPFLDRLSEKEINYFLYMNFH